MIKKISKFPVVRFLCSIKLTLFCLSFLFVHTLWGTFYQTEYGLYQAQHKIFYSWIISVWGIFYLPGVKLILWILFINLSSSTIFRFKYNRYKIGIVIIHSGLLLLLFSSGITYYFSQDSHLTLKEGTGANVSIDFHEWEIAIWTEEIKKDSIIRFVEAQDITSDKIGKILEYSSKSISIDIQEFHLNTGALLSRKQKDVINISGIARFTPLPIEGQSEKNVAGVRFKITLTEESKEVLLFAGDGKETPVRLNDQVYFLKLRRRHYPLPITLVLNKFKKREYLGTEIAKSFESFVSQRSSKIKRDLVISMNQPMRYEDYTFFQTSFSEEQGFNTSTLTVVKNPGRLLPYISCLFVGGGLIVHFILMLIRFTVRRQNEE